MAVLKFDSIISSLQILKEFELAEINEFLYGVSTHAFQENQNLINRANDIKSNPSGEVDKDWLLEVLGDNSYILSEMTRLSYELAIIALYKKIEITTKRAILTAYPDISKTTYSKLDKIDKLKIYLQDKEINLEFLPNYQAMDEIRLLNNAIKHSGKVGKDLSEKYSSNWGGQKGKSLGNLQEVYNRLSPLCILYMEKFIETLIEKRKAV